MSTENNPYELELLADDEAAQSVTDGSEVEGYLLHPSQAVPAWYLKLPPLTQQPPFVPPMPNPGPLYYRPGTV